MKVRDLKTRMFERLFLDSRTNSPVKYRSTHERPFDYKHKKLPWDRPFYVWRLYNEQRKKGWV